MIDGRGEKSSLAYNQWREAVQKFGIGVKLGIDLPGENSGNLPAADYYTKRFGNDKWTSAYNISLSIGQGEMGITPLQMANIMAIVANRGFYYRPHLIKSIGDKKIVKPEFTEKISVGVDAKYFEPVRQGMFDVYNKGTAHHLRIPDIDICGKTGTAENFTRIDGKRVQLTDHSIFIAFAPKDDPKIAIAVFVENGYWGGRYAGRIASLMIEKYIKGEITQQAMEDWVTSRSLEQEYAKPYSGQPFTINQ